MTESPFRAPAIRPNEERYWTFGGLPKGRSPFIYQLFFNLFYFISWSWSRAAWIRKNVPCIQFLKTCTGNVRRKKIIFFLSCSAVIAIVWLFFRKNTPPSIAYLPSRFFQKKSLARKIKFIYKFYL
jgi:hypothetical protein